MQGLVLNEEGRYVTYPFLIFEKIEPHIRNLNWRISNVACGGGSYKFPFEHEEESFMDGDSLFELVKNHRDIQWWRGVLSGFPKSVPEASVRQRPLPDITMEQPYLKNGLHHIEPQAVLEIVAFDSTDTYVLFDGEELADILKKAFPMADNPEKYVFTE